MGDEEFLLDLVGLLNARAEDPEIATRVSALAPRRVGIVVFAEDAHLVSMEVAGSRAVRPDPARTLGQKVYTMLATFGGGSHLHIVPVAPSGIPENSDGTLFTSTKVVGAIVVGWAPGPNGTPVPFDALIAQRDGWLSFVGTSPADALALVDGFRGLIDDARSKLRATPPPFAGGVAPELAAERSQSRSLGPSREELEDAMRSMGATDDEIRRAFGDGVGMPDQRAEGPRASVPEDRPLPPKAPPVST